MSVPTIVLAPLRAGEEDAARAAIAALGTPFADVPGTHQARVQILRARGRRWRARPQPGVLLAGEHDGPAEPWLAACARELDGVLRHCAFWPGPANPAEVVRWAREREVHAGFAVLSSPGTVEEIGAALETHARVRAMVAEWSAS